MFRGRISILEIRYYNYDGKFFANFCIKEVFNHAIVAIWKQGHNPFLDRNELQPIT